MVLVFGLTATPPGPVTGTVAVTVLVRPLITDTVLLSQLATWMVLVFGLTATPLGWVPTGMVAVTVIQRFAAPAVPCTEGGDAVAAVAASASQVAAAVITIAVRWVSLMMSCLPCLAPAGAQAPRCPRSRHRR